MFLQTAPRHTVPAACVKFSLVCVCVCVCREFPPFLGCPGAGALAQWAGVRRYGWSEKKIVDIFVDVVVKIARSGFMSHLCRQF